MKISFIGGGNMAEAMLSGIFARGIGQPSEISVSDVLETRRQYLQQKYGVNTTPDNCTAIAQGEVVILAIKPQTLPKVLTELGGHLRPDQLVLSIIAGARIETLSGGLKHSRIVRSMPNTPAQISEGMTVWTATPEVSEEQKGWAKAILGAIGQEIYVDDEKYLDMATAVSGSGPAYFFFFVEVLTEAAVNIGLPRDIAGKLVLQTMLGSGHLIEKSGRTPEELRRMVTSPGGTTAEALAVLEKGGFSQLVTAAVKAAHEKARKLGGR